MTSPPDSTISTSISSSPVSFWSSVVPLGPDSPFANLDYPALLQLFNEQNSAVERHQFYIRLCTLGENNVTKEEILAGFLPHLGRDMMGRDDDLFIGANRLLACWFFERRFSVHGAAAVDVVLEAIPKHDKQRVAVLLHVLVQQELEPEIILPLLPKALARLGECAHMLDSRPFQVPLVKCLQRFQSQLPNEMRAAISSWLPLICPFMFDADNTPNGEDACLRKLAVGVVSNAVGARTSLDHPDLCNYLEGFIFQSGVDMMKNLVAKGEQAALAPALSNCLLMMGPSVMKIPRRPATGPNETLINVLLDVMKPWLTRGEPEVMNLMFAETWKSLMIVFTLSPANLRAKNVDLLTKPIKFRLARKDTAGTVRDTVVSLWLELCHLVGSRIVDPTIFESTVVSMLPSLYSHFPTPSVVAAMSRFLCEMLEPSEALSSRLGLDEQQEIEWYARKFSFFSDQIVQFFHNFDPQCKEHGQNVFHALLSRASWLASKIAGMEGVEFIGKAVGLFADVLRSSQEGENDDMSSKQSRIERLTPVYLAIMEEFQSTLPFSDTRLHHIQAPPAIGMRPVGVFGLLMWHWTNAFQGRKFKTSLLKCFRAGVISLVPGALLPDPVSSVHMAGNSMFELLAHTRLPSDHRVSSQARRIYDLVQLMDFVKIDPNCSTSNLPASSLVWLVYIVVLERVCKFGQCWELVDGREQQQRDETFVQWTDLVFFLLLFPLKSEHSKDIHCNDQSTEKTIESKVWLSWIDLLRHALALAPPFSWLTDRLTSALVHLPISSPLGWWMALHLVIQLLTREGQSEEGWLTGQLNEGDHSDIQCLSARLLCLVGPNCSNPMWCGLLKDFLQSLCSLRLSHRSSTLSWFVGLSMGLTSALTTVPHNSEADRNRDTIWEAVVALHSTLIVAMQQHYKGPFNVRLLQAAPRADCSPIGSVGQMLVVGLNHLDERIRVTTKHFFQASFLPNSHVSLQTPITLESLIRVVEEHEQLLEPHRTDSAPKNESKMATTPSFLRHDKSLPAVFKKHTPEPVPVVHFPKAQPPKRLRNQISEIASQTEYVRVETPIPKMGKVPEGPLTDNQLATRRRDRSVTTYFNSVDESQVSEAPLIQPCTPSGPEISEVQESLVPDETLGDLPSTMEAPQNFCGIEPPGSLTSEIVDRTRTPDEHIRKLSTRSDREPCEGDSQETSVIEREDTGAPTNLGAAFDAAMSQENKALPPQILPSPAIVLGDAQQLQPTEEAREQKVEESESVTVQRRESPVNDEEGAVPVPVSISREEHEEELGESYDLAETEQQKFATPVTPATPITPATPATEQIVHAKDQSNHANALTLGGRVKFDASKNITISPSQNSVTPHPESDAESPLSSTVRKNLSFRSSPPRVYPPSPPATAVASSSNLASSVQALAPITSIAPAPVTAKPNEAKAATDPRFIEVTGTGSVCTNTESNLEEFTAAGSDGSRYITDKASYKAQLHLQAQAKGPPSSILRNSGIYCPEPQYVLVNSPAFKSPALARGEDSSSVISPSLLQCKDPISRILKSFEMSSFRHLFSAKHIRTVGDLAAMTIQEVASLPMKDPVGSVRNILGNYLRAEKASPSDEMRQMLKRQRAEQTENGEEVDEEEESDRKIPTPTKPNERGTKAPIERDQEPRLTRSRSASRETNTKPDLLVITPTRATRSKSMPRTPGTPDPSQVSSEKKQPTGKSNERRSRSRSGGRSSSRSRSCGRSTSSSSESSGGNSHGISNKRSRSVGRTEPEANSPAAKNSRLDQTSSAPTTPNTPLAAVESSSAAPTTATPAVTVTSVTTDVPATTTTATPATSAPITTTTNATTNTTTSTTIISTDTTNTTTTNTTTIVAVASIVATPTSTSTDPTTSDTLGSAALAVAATSLSTTTAASTTVTSTSAPSAPLIIGVSSTTTPSIIPPNDNNAEGKSGNHVQANDDAKEGERKGRNSSPSKPRERHRSRSRRRRKRSRSESRLRDTSANPSSSESDSERRSCCNQGDRDFLDAMRSLIGHLDGSRLSSLSRSQLMELTSLMLGLQIRIVAQLSALEQLSASSPNRSLSLSLILAQGNGEPAPSEPGSPREKAPER